MSTISSFSNPITSTTATETAPTTTESTPPVSRSNTNYSYIKAIKAPSEMGMSDAGNLKTLEKDINGLLAYVQLLVDGPSAASRSSSKGPLGSQFFAPTNATCNVNGTSVPRSIYVDNIPKGGIDAAPGANLPEFRGLVPGMMTGLSAIDPERISESIANSDSPDCIEVTLNVIDSSYNTISETNYITTTDATYIDPCSYTNCVNPITGVKCNGKQGFTNRSELLFSEIKHDYVSQMFLTSVGVLSIYVLHLLVKNRFKYR
jgi:hypothetical protein